MIFPEHSIARPETTRVDGNGGLKTPEKRRWPGAVARAQLEASRDLAIRGVADPRMPLLVCGQRTGARRGHRFGGDSGRIIP